MLLAEARAEPARFARRVAVVPSGALASPEAVVPMAGRWVADDAVLRFEPALPFTLGTVYVVVRRGDAGGPTGPLWTELARLRRPAPAAAPTASVVAIHPDVDRVPENLLRLSITFSDPMEEGSAAGRVHLQDPTGEELDHALLPLPPELWDRARRRLTVLIEPGRIKRGLVPNTELGAPLAMRDAVDLVVDASVRDAAGVPLVGGARRSYRVGPAIRSRVDPARWRTSWPRPGSPGALVIGFDRPMDHALALRCLRVTDRTGRPVPGRASVDRGETRWSFLPEAPWPDLDLQLRVDTALEDLAGNSVRRVFDRDLAVEDDDPVDSVEVVLASAPPDHGGPGSREVL